MSLALCLQIVSQLTNTSDQHEHQISSTGTSKTICSIFGRSDFYKRLNSSEGRTKWQGTTPITLPPTHCLQPVHVVFRGIGHAVSLLHLPWVHNSISQDDLGNLNDEAHGQEGIGVGVVRLLAFHQTCTAKQKSLSAEILLQSYLAIGF